jgi:hypothetical protein
MRKLSAGLVMLALLWMCSASFGYFLVYNVSATVNGVDYETELRVSVPLKGYLVLRLNDSNELQDANLVLYGKDANTPKSKVYVQLNYFESSDSNCLKWDIGTPGGEQGNLVSSNFWTYANKSSPFDFEWLITGQKSVKNVGYIAGDRKVASSLKGVFMVWDGMLLDADQDIQGTSNISMTLNTAYTKGVNGTNPAWTQDKIIEGQIIGGKLRGIKPDLESKGFQNVTPNQL